MVVARPYDGNDGLPRPTPTYLARNSSHSYSCEMRFVLVLLALMSSTLAAQQISVRGRVVDPEGRPLPNASVSLLRDGAVVVVTNTTANGDFLTRVTTEGEYIVKAEASGFRPVVREVKLPSHDSNIEIEMNELAPRMESITVTANANTADVLSPDPSEKVFVTQDLLDANPGRPGAPISIPGYPIETASSGIKAPQYFAPGVAGDHGEPIAQFIALGSFLLPNNLSANAHGNGYADPNIFIPQILESVQVDGGAFNVREGNHSVNLAATYGLRSDLDSFLTVTGDYRDIDAVAGFSPTADSFVALEGSYGNGFLDRMEHRQQYKFNAQRAFHAGNHEITLLGIAYYGQSYVPGLVPIFPVNAADASFPNLGDTIDPRQRDQTHTAIVGANDVWKLNGNQELQLSGFFRTYNLSLYSDFGQGLIRQSEFRTVTGGNVNYVNRLSEYFSLLLGSDLEREAPRRDDLDHYGFFDTNDPSFYGLFRPVAANDVTIGSISPYIAAQGALSRYFRYYLGWRRDEISFDNQDLLVPANSFQQWVGVNSPKATVSFLPKQQWYVPLVSLSFGQAFYTNDPRIGMGTTLGTPVSTAHSYQLVVSKSVKRTDIRLTLGHVTTSESLAKLDPDTGLQYDEGPGRLRFATLAVQQSFSRGSLLATFSKADARDLVTGEPTPEAPRTIFDLLGTLQRLPLRLQLRGEFEFVGAKPLGTGCLPNPASECTGVAVKEFRGALSRPFLRGRMNTGINFLIASGYTGQTTENFFPSSIQEIVGVRIPSYASLSVTYRFSRLDTGVAGKN